MPHPVSASVLAADKFCMPGVFHRGSSSRRSCTIRSGFPDSEKFGRGQEPIAAIAQQKLTSAQERLTIWEERCSIWPRAWPTTRSRGIPDANTDHRFGEPSVEVQAVRMALAAQETPSTDLVVAPTTVSTSTAALTSTVPITAQAVALADTQSGAVLELAVSPPTAAQELSPTEAPTQTPLLVPSPHSPLHSRKP